MEAEAPPPPGWSTPTFTLQALPEEAFEQLLAVLADGGTGVRVDQEGVGDFDLGQQQLVQLDGPANVGLRAGAALPRREVVQLVLLLRGSVRDGQTGTRLVSSGSERTFLPPCWERRVTGEKKKKREITASASVSRNPSPSTDQQRVLAVVGGGGLS